MKRSLRFCFSVVFLIASLMSLSGCGGGDNSSATENKYRLSICDADPIVLSASPGTKQSQGCVVNYTQTTADSAYIKKFGTNTMQRRYLVYAPKNLSQTPVPVVFVFPGYGTNAESAAVYYTQTRFETLADRDGFVVVYGNGLPYLPDGESSDDQFESGGYF